MGKTAVVAGAGGDTASPLGRCRFSALFSREQQSAAADGGVCAANDGEQAAYLSMSQMLASGSVRVPQVQAVDLQRGFLFVVRRPAAVVGAKPRQRRRVLPSSYGHAGSSASRGRARGRAAALRRSAPVG